MTAGRDKLIELGRAKSTAEWIVKCLAPYCKLQSDGKTPYILVTGSVRRRRPWVKDIDLVMIPSDWWNFNSTIKKIAKIKAAGPKEIRLTVGETPLDIYIATEETWGTLVLIRTGSAEHNKRLCTIALERGMHLAADGSGLFNAKEDRIAGESEASIYRSLGLKYKEPWERG